MYGKIIGLCKTKKKKMKPRYNNNFNFKPIM